MAAPVSLRQPTGVRIYLGFLLVVWCAFMLANAIVAASLVSVVPVALLVGGGLLIWGTLNVKATADESGLTIRNTFRTTRLDWDDVEEFRTAEPTRRLPNGRIVHVVKRDGEALPLEITVRRLGRGDAAEKLDAELTALRAWLPSGAAAPADT